TDDELKALRSGGTAKPGALEANEVGTWKVQNSPAKKITGDKLTPDHIPSRAALVAEKEAQLGRKLTPAEAKAINDEGVTIGTEHSIHVEGRTYLYKNKPGQIALDALDLGTAARKDIEAILNVHKARGSLTPEVVGAYLKVYRANVLKGVFKYNKETEEMFMKFIEEAKKL